MLLGSAGYGTATETHPMRFDRLTPEAGLSQSSVVTILQDSQGFMWFGTESGLNRYDGYDFEQFRQERGNPAALNNDFIYDLAEGPDGTLWIATKGGGLSAYDPGRGDFRNYRHESDDPGSIAGNFARAVLADKDGTVWVGLRDGGLDRFDPRTETFTHVELGEATTVVALHIDATGILWVGSDQGLYALDPADGSFTSYRHDAGNESSISEDLVRSVYEDSAGNLWVGTQSGGLNRLDRETGHFERFLHDPENPDSLSTERVTAIFEDSDNRLWIGTARGLNLLNVASGRFVRYHNNTGDASSLGSDAITSIFQDRSGILWVGTLTGGVSKWNPRTWGLGLRNASDLAASDESSPVVTSFATEGGDTLWIGTFGEGLLRLDRREASVTRYRHDPSDPDSISDDRVMALMLDRDGVLWIGTMLGGVNRFDPSTGENRRYTHDPVNARSLGANGVMSIFQDSRGAVWVGTFGGGFSVYDATTDSFSGSAAIAANGTALSASRITSFTEDGHGNVFIGTDAGGLHLFDRDTRTLTQFLYDADDPSSLSSDTIYSLHTDASGTVWIGTNGGGLDRVTGSSRVPARIQFSNLSQKDGLPNDVIYGVQTDDSGRVWLSTNYGISQFNPATGAVKNLHRKDGLQSEEFNFGAHHRSATGELYFGGISGYNVFNPDSLKTSALIPPVVLTGFFKSNDPTKSDLPEHLEDGIEISYQDDNISFEFAALDFAAPEQNRYSYKLEGFDREWIDLGHRRRVTYTDLDDGNYLLRVRAANSDGIWNETGIALPLRVTPAPWDTWWAYLGYAAMLAQLAMFLWYGHLRKVRREEEYSHRLELEVRQRTVSLAKANAELKGLNKSLQESSLSDPLTGLRNRRFVFEEVSRDLAAISRKYSNEDDGIDAKDTSDLVFMMIDLDNFKPINDTYGHAAGDELLLCIRDVLLNTCRRSDFVIRWGGDEFVVIAKQAHRGESEALAERIRREIAERSFSLQEGQIIRTTCSIGFVAYPLFRGQADNGNLDEVINLADSLMYEAKRQRNAWVGMLGINEAVTSKGFDCEGLEPSSILFRSRRSGRVYEHDRETVQKALGEVS